MPAIITRLRVPPTAASLSSHLIAVAVSILDFQRVQWTSNGRALTYIKTTNGTSNIWSYDLNGGASRQLTDFKTEKMYAYAWSSDYKQLACERGTDIGDVMIITRQR